MGNHEADVKRVQLIARTAVENILQKILKKKEEMSVRATETISIATPSS